MTEEQAREKWCPFARVVFYEFPGIKEGNMAAANRGRRADTRCIASDCVAWRFGEKEIHPERGYCGLAGSPERA